MDGDSDGFCDAGDLCPADPLKFAPGQCGCGVLDLDTDSDGTADCVDTDNDNDGVPDSSDTNTLDPAVCADSDLDTCDDCAVGVDGFGPLPDNDPATDWIVPRMSAAVSSGKSMPGIKAPRDRNGVAVGQEPTQIPHRVHRSESTTASCSYFRPSLLACIWIAPNGQSSAQRWQPLQLARSTTAAPAIFAGGSQGATQMRQLIPTSSNQTSPGDPICTSGYICR